MELFVLIWFVLFFYVIAKNIGQFIENENSPILTVPATIVDMRRKTHHHHSNGHHHPVSYTHLQCWFMDREVFEDFLTRNQPDAEGQKCLDEIRKKYRLTPMEDPIPVYAYSAGGV